MSLSPNPYRFEVLDIRAPSQWDNVVKQFGLSTFFHTAAWPWTLTDAYGYKPFYCVWFDDRDIPVAAIPILEVRTLFGTRRGVSLPFSDFCPPLVAETVLLDHLSQPLSGLAKSRSWDSIELRGGHALFDGKPTSISFLTHVVEINRPAEQLLSSFRQSTARNIRKAQRYGISVEQRDDAESVRIFYRLNCLTRRNHGLPPQPFRFFERLHANILAGGHGFITLGWFNSAPIAGAMYLIHGSTAYYKYGASDRRYYHLRPNNLIVWEGILEAARRGCSTMNFGRTDTHHAGLTQFKRGFSTTETSGSYYTLACPGMEFVHRSPAATVLPKPITVLFSIMPMPLLRLMGIVMYPLVG